LSLEQSKVDVIYFRDFDSHEQLIECLTSRGFQVDLVERSLHRFGEKRLVFCNSTLSQALKSLILVGGSLRYIDSFVGSMQKRTESWVIVNNGRPSGILVSDFNHSNVWMIICHEAVGGVTRFASLFCSTMDIDPVISTLRRMLQHMVNYSIRPLCIKTSDHRFETALTLCLRLHPNDFNHPIV
jgi:hypothetical protein